MMISELTAEIQRLESGWNGLDQEPALRIYDLQRERAEVLRRLGGCCGEREQLGQSIRCRWFAPCYDLRCRAALAGHGFAKLDDVLEMISELERALT